MNLEFFVDGLRLVVVDGLGSRWAWSSMWGDSNNKWRCCQPLTFNSTWKAAKRTLHRTKRTKKSLGNSFQCRLKKGNKQMQNRGSKKSNRRRKDSLEILALRLVFCVWKELHQWAKEKPHITYCKEKKSPNLFMISLGRSASIIFSVHSLSCFIWLRKKLYSSRWMLNNLTKLPKIVILM